MSLPEATTSQDRKQDENKKAVKWEKQELVKRVKKSGGRIVKPRPFCGVKEADFPVL